MQLFVTHHLSEPLLLPINYQNILQGIIYKNLENAFGYSHYMHDQGFQYGQRQFRPFLFSMLNGHYEIEQGKIRFMDKVWWEVRSPEVFPIRMLSENFKKNGIWYGKYHCRETEVELVDDTIEWDSIPIRMVTPICVYSTNAETKKTYFYSPDEAEFYSLINDNFFRKYKAYYGIAPESSVSISAVHVTEQDKVVTKYKDFYISGWKGDYYLRGERKYLDFLYQTGLGSKNAQGFGMFIINSQEQ